MEAKGEYRMKQKVIHTSGIRKTAVARATLKPGKGVIRINGLLLDHYSTELRRLKIKEALLLAGDVVKKVDIKVNVKGGGPNAQAEAIRLAIARALAEYDSKLKDIYLEYDRQLLVADTRRKEQRKPLHHGKARAKKQTSYR